ncbi:MAG: hypothetical protein AB1631_30940 [Acidobacteriota bacterium]
MNSNSGALIIAHPGHELRVYGWIARVRPIVFVLTDGSGHAGRSRLDSTTAILDQLGARRGSVYGRLTDKQLYAAILDHECALLANLIEEIADALIADEITLVAGDAMEGYNSGHDLCRVIADAAVKRASRRSGSEIASFDFPLTGHPDSCSESARNAIRLELDDQTFDRKIAAARRYRELFNDVEQAFREHGEEAFRVECLRPVVEECIAPFDEPPFYESYGERQVAAGYYDRVLRYRQHFLPLALELRRRAEEKS